MIISVFGESNARLIYVLDFIQGYFEDVEFKVVDELPDASEIAINYSGRTDVHGLRIDPSGLLMEFGIGYTQPKLSHVKEEPVLFGDATKFGFDVFSAIFYMITRYEEYNPLKKDEHGRFPAKGCIAEEYGFLEEPIVDIWVELLISAIESTYSKEVKRVRSRHAVPSVDIDVAWAYLNKGAMRTIAAHLKDAAGFDLHGIRSRSRVLSKKLRDPYDTYDLIEESFMGFHEPLIFSQMGNYGRYDKNIDYRNQEFRKLLKRLDLTGNVSLHPSYASFRNLDLIKVEKERLEDILGHEVKHSRFHFLRYRLPRSYRALLESGITHDHSMGYADAYGFRAGTARPFKWYDIDREEKTELMIHPFVYMDGTLNQYMGLEPDDAKELISRLFDEIQCGNFEFIWHNSTLNDEGRWAGWKDVFQFTLDRAKRWENSKNS